MSCKIHLKGSIIGTNEKTQWNNKYSFHPFHLSQQVKENNNVISAKCSGNRGHICDPFGHP